MSEFSYDILLYKSEHKDKTKKKAFWEILYFIILAYIRIKCKYMFYFLILKI